MYSTADLISLSSTFQEMSSTLIFLKKLLQSTSLLLSNFKFQFFKYFIDLCSLECAQ